MKDHLFHTVLPIPECCNTQMRLAGNLSLHVIEYECSRCFSRLRVTAAFVVPERVGLTKAEADAIDQTP